MNTKTIETPIRYAVIDIGTNAVRLNIGVMTAQKFVSETFVRLPIALGADTLTEPYKVTAPMRKRLKKALHGMHALIESVSPVHWQAVATASLRGAANRDEIITELREECNVPVRVLSGTEEATVIGHFVAAQFPQHNAVINIDIGGGSTDIALIVNGKPELAETFSIGTARHWKECIAEYPRLAEWWVQMPADAMVCGSGGNVRKLTEMCATITAANLGKWQKRLSTLPVADIAARYDLAPDKAQRLDNTFTVYRTVLKITGKPLAAVDGGLAEAVILDIAGNQRSLK